MVLPNNSEIVTSTPAQPPKWKRRGWSVAILFCAGALLWFGLATYLRTTRTWQTIHAIPGFVSYGAHTDAFSPNTNQVAIAHREQAKVVDWVRGQELCRLEQYQNQGIADFSSNGRLVSYPAYTASARRVLCVWDAADGRLLGQLELPDELTDQWCRIEFSPDSKVLVAAHPNGLIAWDMSDFTQVSQIKTTWDKENRYGPFFTWHPITHDMTTIDADGQLKRVDLQQKTVTPLLARQDRAVQAAFWSPDGVRLATLDREDGTVTIREASSGTGIVQLAERAVRFAEFSPDGKRIVTTIPRSNGLWDLRTQVWDTQSGELIRELPTRAGVTFSPDWSFWADAGAQGVRIARFDGSESCHYPYCFDGHGSTRRFSADNRFLAYVNASGLVRVWQHRDLPHSWLDWLFVHELWMALLALVGMVWSIRRRFRRATCTTTPYERS